MIHNATPNPKIDLLGQRAFQLRRSSEPAIA